MLAFSRKLALVIEDVITLETANSIIRRIRPEKGAETEEDKIEVIAYGINYLLGTVIKILFILLLSFLLGTAKPTLVIVAAFVSFRSIAGGQHMDTYVRCLMVSVLLFLIFGLLAQYVIWDSLTKNIILAATIIFSLYTSLFHVPRTHQNHRIREEKQRRLKAASLIYIAVFSVFMFFIKSNMYVVAASFGLFLVCFTIVPFGYNLFDKLNGGAK